MSRGSARTERGGGGGLWLVGVLGLALLIRLMVTFALPSLHHPDENYQLFEQAHRLAFGYGVVPWEFDYGTRSFALPYVLAGSFAIAEPLFGGPEGYLRFTQVLIAVLSLAPVAALYRMGRRASATHAILVGLVAATWFELVYFSYRPLTEAIATDFVLIALALASPLGEQMTFRRLAAIGSCLALAVMLRVHLAPGVLFVFLWLGRLYPRRWSALALGAAPVVVLFGALDWLTWGAPFRSYLQAFRINLWGSVASQYGVKPPYWFLERIAATWSGAVPVLALLVARRLRRSLVWVGFSVVVILSHSLIPHKEYRFIFPALACLVVVAAMSSADLVEAVRAREHPGRHPLLIAATCWMIISASLAVSPFFVGNWTRSRDEIRASFWLAGRPDLCGVALDNIRLVQFGGYAFLHRNVPIYTVGAGQVGGDPAKAFNYVLLNRTDLAELQPTYRLAWCAGGRSADQTCLATRAGPCQPASGLTPVSAWIARYGGHVGKTPQ